MAELELKEFSPLTSELSDGLRVTVVLATVMVVIRHAFNLEGYYPDGSYWMPIHDYNCLIQRAVNVFTAQAVPTFFLMSSFLFFYKINDVKKIGLKLKTRIRTLLIPYLLWNLIYIFFICGLTGWNLQSVSCFASPLALLKAFTIAPALGVFWYIRTLLVFLLISPLIFWSYRSCWSTLLVLIISGRIWHAVDLGIFSSEGFFFFYLGGLIAYYRFYEKFSLVRYPWLILCGWIFVITVIVFRLFWNVAIILWYVNVLVSVYLLLQTGMWLSHQTIRNVLFRMNHHALFIYALHIMSFNLLGLWSGSLPKTPEWSLGIFMIRCIIGCLFPIAVSIMLKKFSPKIHSVLTGGR